MPAAVPGPPIIEIEPQARPKSGFLPISAITPLPTAFCKMIITMLRMRSMITALPLLNSSGMLTVKPTVVKNMIIKTVCSVSSKVMTAVPVA